MKKILLATLCVSSMFASASFDKNKQYTCINSHNIQQGQQISVDPKDAGKHPFIFTIKEDKLIANNNNTFDFKMKRGLMSSYSNTDYMLLLTPGMVLGLVPRKSKGSVQYYFTCKAK
jgi:hypothetical protein